MMPPLGGIILTPSILLNMSLTLRAAKRHNVNTPVNGETMLDRKTEILEEVQNNITSDKIVVGQWKRVQTEKKGQTKSVMKIVDTEMTKTDFVKHVTTQADDFNDHVKRIRMQFSEMKKLKENLPAHHCIVHMDFSENYVCKSVEEVQSAYWSQTSVTLHPTVIYYMMDGTREILHKSIAVVSDEMGHNAPTVLTIIDKLVPEIKHLIPELTCIHYWTDSPTSQYRNKIIFNAIANHASTYGIDATWNYWEAGHGKGPCDGLGGTVKRMADDAVKTGKVAIQDPSDFYAWTQSEFCTMQNVKFVFVSTESCQEKAVETRKHQLKPISGTMKLHAVKGKGMSVVSVRDTSCYCEVCIVSAASTCNTWKDENTSNETMEDKAYESFPVAEADIDPPIQEITMPYITQNDYVAAVYLNKWYIGKVINADAEDDTFEVSFLEHKKKSYQWPSRPDVIWVDKDDILCKVSAPKAIGKTKRMMEMNPTDIKHVEELFYKL